MPPTLFRDEISRVSILQARAASGIAPRLFKALSSITLMHGDATYEVNLRRIDGRGCVATTTEFECPKCRATARVLAFSYYGIGCLKCTPWRSREYRVSAHARAPHVRNAVATVDEL